MKLAIFYGICGLVCGFSIGYNTASIKKHYDSPPKDINLACHTVYHYTSDGDRFWSCEKNQ